MNSEAKWTPGPWVIDPETRPAEVCTIHGLPDEQTDGQGWAHIRGALGYWSADEDEQMANAHLIAAAPDLYEALDMLMDASGPGDSAQLLAEERENIIELLAKARGTKQ